MLITRHTVGNELNFQNAQFLDDLPEARAVQHCAKDCPPTKYVPCCTQTAYNIDSILALKWKPCSPHFGSPTLLGDFCCLAKVAELSIFWVRLS